ncbi:preli-like [Lycorma delicatula]|uniref:preli-like n=1 Tax=Lycorma delicatula TaxID=130591 RepID=UPI003F515716
MVKYFESTNIYYYTWEQVVQGFWKRYPNPESDHVLSEDTISREVKDNKLITKRLLTKTGRPPKWGERLIGARIVKIVEESVVDPKERTFTTYTRNLGYTKVMTAVEKVVYKVSDENPNWTVAVKSTWIDSKVFGFGRAIQAFGVERMKKHYQRMVVGFNYVLSKLYPNQTKVSDEQGAGGSGSSGHQTHISATMIPGKDKIKDAAKKASDIAKSKTGIYVSCQPSQT